MQGLAWDGEGPGELLQAMFQPGRCYSVRPEATQNFKVNFAASHQS